MPPREPRAVILLREYFSDHDFQTTLTAMEREAYMGLAQLADDEGWIEWKPGDIASHVYRFQPEPISLLNRAIPALERSKRLRIYRCGHAQLLRWGSNRHHLGRPGPEASAVAEAHRTERKGSAKLPEQSAKLRKVSIPKPIPDQDLRPVPNPEPDLKRRASGREGQMTQVGETQAKLRERWGKRA